MEGERALKRDPISKRQIDGLTDKTRHKLPRAGGHEDPIGEDDNMSSTLNRTTLLKQMVQCCSLRLPFPLLRLHKP